MNSYHVFGRISPTKPTAIFDLDGVLIDSSERYKRSLEDIGAKDGLPWDDWEKRRRFWKIFLSDKYMYLDKPVPEAMKYLERAIEKKYQILIITGRPERMINPTLKQLGDFGISFDAIVFRGEGNYAKDYEYKQSVIKGLGLRNIVEGHDDNSEIALTYTMSRLGGFFWYRIGKTVLLPSFTIFVSGMPVDLSRINYPSLVRTGRVHVEWLNYGYTVRDGVELIGLASYIRSTLGELNGLYNPDMIEYGPIDILEYLRDTDPETGEIIIDGERFPCLHPDTIDLDEIFSPDVIREKIYEYGSEAVNIMVDQMFPVKTPFLADTEDYVRDKYLRLIEIRRKYPEPRGISRTPMIDSMKDIFENRDIIREIALITAYDLSKTFELRIPDTNYELVIEHGSVYIRTHVKTALEPPSTKPAPQTLGGLIREIQAIHGFFAGLSVEIDSIRNRVEEELRKKGVPFSGLYVIPQENEMLVLADITPSIYGEALSMPTGNMISF